MALRNATRRPARDLLLAAEALCLLGLFRIALALVPVRRILRAITHVQLPPSQAPPIPHSATDLEAALRVRWAVEAVTRNSAARFVCFPQTLAGYTMLRRRGVSSAMVYGVARSPAGDLIAHTWLTLGDRILLGGEGSAAFTPLDRWT
jgi:hypothetical protein